MIRYLFFVSVCMALAGCVERRPGDTAPAVKEEWSDSLLIKTGDLIITQTFDTLRKALLSAIQSQGFPGAIDFCNEKANSLTSVYTDSVMVRRTSLRYRNPANRPDSLEIQVLKTWNEQWSVGRKPQGRLLRRGGEIHYFKPIHMQAVCMNCHGSPQKNIQPATLSAIRKHYPQDLAIDFKEGDLRGSWHLVFEKKP